MTQSVPQTIAKCKKKIQCIYGSPAPRIRALWEGLKTTRHRKVLGDNIRTHRRNRKWSQEVLAEKADLHRNYIGDVERGEENVSVDTLAKIAEALGVSIIDLFRGL